MEVGWWQKDIGEWGVRTFGHDSNTLHSIIAHLLKEAEELRTAGSVGEIREEAADVFILLCSIAHVSGFHLETAVADKMWANKKRQWKKPDGQGVIEHEPDEGAP